MNSGKLKKSEKPAYQQWIIAVAFQIIAPWIPLFIEAAIKNGQVSSGSLTIVAALFSLSVAVSSVFVAFWAVASLISVIFSAFYGIVLVAPDKLPFAGTAAVVTMILIGITHCLERYWRHAYCGDKFLAFHLAPFD